MIAANVAEFGEAIEVCLKDATPESLGGVDSFLDLNSGTRRLMVCGKRSSGARRRIQEVQQITLKDSARSECRCLII